MRYIVYIVFLITSFANGAVYYVSSTGGTGAGTSTGTAWSWNYFTGNSTTLVSPGDIVWVKAGTYTDINRTIAVSGNSSNPIYIIGYLTTVTTPTSITGGDVDQDAETTITLGTETVNRPSTLWYGSSPSASNMPYFSRGVAATGTHLTINGSYVHLYNMQFRGGAVGVTSNGNFNTLKNIYVFDVTKSGTPAPYFGRGINNAGDNCTLKNIYIENVGAQAFTNKGDDNTFDNFAVICDDTGNPTDYYFLYESGIRNNASNIYIRRVGNLSHGGHGIVFKPDISTPASDNLVETFIIDNTNIEPQFPGCYDNVFRDGYIVNGDYNESTGNLWNRGGARIANNSHDNTFENIYFKNCTIKFADWDDGKAGEGLNNTTGTASYNNTFHAITVDGGRFAVAPHYFGNSFYSGTTYGNVFYNSTFYGTKYVLETSRPATIQFTNCIFDSITDALEGVGDGSAPVATITDTYTNCNFSNNGFSAPSGTNITTLSPSFTDAANGDFEVGNATLQTAGTSTPYVSSGGVLGSFVGGSTPPPGDTTTPSVTSLNTSNILDDGFTVTWTLDEGSKGYIRYGTTTGVYTDSTNIENRFLTSHVQPNDGNPKVLSANTLYYFQVYLEDAAGNTGYSAEYNETTLESGGNPDPENSDPEFPSTSRKLGGSVYLKTKKN